jgi:hypothetical protein
MLLPIFSTAAPTPGFAAILFGQERDMPHGFFGDRDASHHASARQIPPGCGLFGRLGDAPPLRPDNDGRDRPQDEPRGRA